jgi:CRISPR-associated endonuclease/helicase Cas3
LFIKLAKYLTTRDFVRFGEDGIFTLTAATGAGKTLASLRYALVHAEKTGKDHIYIIAPYTSILDQTVDVLRSILDPDGKNDNTLVIHHSNLEQVKRPNIFLNHQRHGMYRLLL